MKNTFLGTLHSTLDPMTNDISLSETKPRLTNNEMGVATFSKRINGFSVGRTRANILRKKIEEPRRSFHEERYREEALLNVDRVSMKSEGLQWVLLWHKGSVVRNDGNSTGR